MKLPAHKIKSGVRQGALYAYPRQKSIDNFKEQIRKRTKRRIPLREKESLRDYATSNPSELKEHSGHKFIPINMKSTGLENFIFFPLGDLNNGKIVTPYHSGPESSLVTAEEAHALAVKYCREYTN